MSAMQTPRHTHTPTHTHTTPTCYQEAYLVLGPDLSLCLPFGLGLPG